MSARPLPGASYHTCDAILHSFGGVDFEAVGSLELETLDSHSEEKSHSSDESTPLLESKAHNRHGYPMLLALLVFCMAFTASAFLGYSPSRWLMPDVPDHHASIADQLSSAFQAQSYRTLVNEYYNDALVAMCVRSRRPIFFSPFLPVLSLDSDRNSIGTKNRIVYVMNARMSLCGAFSAGLSLFCACLAEPFLVLQNFNK